MYSHNITPFLRWSFPASRLRRAVLCLPVNVFIRVILSIVVCPEVVVLKRVGAPGVRVAGWDWAAAVLLAEVMGVHAGITSMSPGVAIATVVVLVAIGGEVANLMTGVAAGPSF